MKKSLFMKCALTIMMVILFCSAFLVNVSATEAGPGFYIDFSDEEIFEQYYTTHANLEYSFEEDALLIESTGGPDAGGNGDPNMTFKLDDLDGDTYYWMKIRLKNLGTAPEFQLHFNPSGGITAATNTLFPITTNDTEYKDYIINIKTTNKDTLPRSKIQTPAITDTETLWAGSIQEIRLDFMFINFPGGQVPSGSQMYVKYFAIFASEADAIAYDISSKPTATPVPTSTPAEPSSTSTNTASAEKTNVVSPTANPKSNGKLSTGVIIGIAAAGVLVCGAVVAVIIIMRKKKS